MGTGAFIYAPKYAKYDLAGAGVLGPGVLLVFSLWRIILQIRYKINNDTWLKRTGSRVWENGKPKYKTLIPLLGNAATNAGYLVVMTVAWDFAKEGGLNQGVVSTLLSFASVFNVFTFYCYFNEKITVWQGFGILFMLLCIMCIGIESGRKGKENDGKLEVDEDEGGRSKMVSCFFGILLGLVGAILMSSKYFLIRLYKGGYAAFD